MKKDQRKRMVSGQTKPLLTIFPNNAYWKDCVKGMKQYPDQYFDLAVVDPQYGINSKNGDGSTKLKGRLNSGSGKLKNRILNRSEIDWDNQIPTKEYFDELFRVSKNQIIWGGNYFDLPPTRGVIVWDKKQPWENFSQFEYAWTSFDCPAKMFRYSSRSRPNRESKIHPTQKPIALYDFCFRNFAKKGMKILDTHLGSGSIRISAYKADLEFVGFETNKKHFDDQEERFNDFKKLDMKQSAPQKAKQLILIPGKPPMSIGKLETAQEGGKIDKSIFKLFGPFLATKDLKINEAFEGVFFQEGSITATNQAIVLHVVTETEHRGIFKPNGKEVIAGMFDFSTTIMKALRSNAIRHVVDIVKLDNYLNGIIPELESVRPPVLFVAYKNEVVVFNPLYLKRITETLLSQGLESADFYFRDDKTVETNALVVVSQFEMGAAYMMFMPMRMEADNYKAVASQGIAYKNPQSQKELKGFFSFEKNALVNSIGEPIQDSSYPILPQPEKPKLKAKSTNKTYQTTMNKDIQWVKETIAPLNPNQVPDPLKSTYEFIKKFSSGFTDYSLIENSPKSMENVANFRKVYEKTMADNAPKPKSQATPKPVKAEKPKRKATAKGRTLKEKGMQARAKVKAAKVSRKATAKPRGKTLKVGAYVMRNPNEPIYGVIKQLEKNRATVEFDGGVVSLLDFSEFTPVSAAEYNSVTRRSTKATSTPKKSVKKAKQKAKDSAKIKKAKASQKATAKPLPKKAQPTGSTTTVKAEAMSKPKTTAKATASDKPKTEKKLKGPTAAEKAVEKAKDKLKAIKAENAKYEKRINMDSDMLTSFVEMINKYEQSHKGLGALPMALSNEIKKETALNTLYKRVINRNIKAFKALENKVKKTNELPPKLANQFLVLYDSLNGLKLKQVAKRTVKPTKSTTAAKKTASTTKKSTPKKKGFFARLFS